MLDINCRFPTDGAYRRYKKLLAMALVLHLFSVTSHVRMFLSLAEGILILVRYNAEQPSTIEEAFSSIIFISLAPLDRQRFKFLQLPLTEV